MLLVREKVGLLPRPVRNERGEGTGGGYGERGSPLKEFRPLHPPFLGPRSSILHPQLQSLNFNPPLHHPSSILSLRTSRCSSTIQAVTTSAATFRTVRAISRKRSVPRISAMPSAGRPKVVS